MPAKRSNQIATPLALELAEALKQQRATSAILRAIARSPNDVQPVFETIAKNVVRLCNVTFCQVFRFDGNLIHFAAHHGLSPEAVDDIRRAYPMSPGRASAVARAILSCAIEQIPDIYTDSDYKRHQFAKAMNFRSVVAVPMLKDGRAIGAIAMARSQPGHFPERQIELLGSFADQAAIAVENVRLFDEVQARTRDLTNALEQQKATAEVLRIIGTSPNDVQPVFETIVQNAVSITGSLFANVFRFDGELLHFAASHNVGPSYVELLQTKYPMRPDSSQVSGRVLLTGSVVRLDDVFTDPDYDQRFPRALGWRKMLGVPMLRKGEALGVVVVGWAEPGPVSTAQEELLKTFADQAVIAIENARLFDDLQARTRELSEALEYQTATSEVLNVISRSPTQLQPVLDAIVNTAARLCAAEYSYIARYDDNVLRYVAHVRVSDEHLRFLSDPITVDRGAVIGRVSLEKRTIHVSDVLADPEFDRFEWQKVGKQRTVLGVPLLRENTLIGVIILARTAVAPFTEKQVELVTTFADQAVIAIENARLFDEIQQKSRQLELTDRYKSHFLASASHDLRQPLHALNLFVGQLRTESDPMERAGLIERIDAAVGAMNELFESLLDMSKLEAGILTPDLSEFPVEQVLERVETTFADAGRQKGLRLVVVPSKAWVCSDFVLLERILLNLVSNAVRYTSRGGVLIGCRRRGDALRIDVYDTGAGIPQDQQQNIFREYYQLATAKSAGHGGIGLGLAIVDRLGNLLGHTVEVNSRPGRGSRFSISVPLAAGRSRRADIPNSLTAITDPASDKFVVVIDDDPLVLSGMCGILRSWHCKVVTANSAEAAVAEVAAFGQMPDLIISDYRLADGRTGIEAVEYLRGAMAGHIPAFLISGDTAPERLRDASARGFHLLHKPVPPMRLRAMLSQLLKSQEVSGASAQDESATTPSHATGQGQAPPLQ